MGIGREGKRFVCKIYNYFIEEGRWGRPFYPLQNFPKRTTHALQISKGYLLNIVERQTTDTPNKQGTISKSTYQERGKLNNFGHFFFRDVIRRFYGKNEYISI